MGVHFTNSLLWGKQVKYLREKGDKALLSLRHLLAQKRLPMDVKRLMYTALVRSVQENACGVWTADSKQANSLEAVQNKATAWILRTNSRTGDKARATNPGSALARRAEENAQTFLPEHPAFEGRTDVAKKVL